MVLLGVGNVNMGDDAAGVSVGHRVREMEGGEDWTVFDCGMNPEHYTRDVKKCDPEIVVIVDAVDMALPPLPSPMPHPLRKGTAVSSTTENVRKKSS